MRAAAWPVGGELYAEAEPWEVIGAAHMIEVITLP